MKISITLLFLLVVFSLTAQSIHQQVFASGGVTLNNASYQLTFTVGEPVIGTIQNNTIVNQGFLAASSSGSTLSIDDEILNESVKIYPNPVRENLSIDFTNIAGQIKVMLYTISGQLLKTSTMNQQSNTLNVSNLQNGIYLVKLHFTDYNTTKIFKIIKK